MQIAEKPRTYTLEEYLDLEDQADFKSEYFDGAIVPMAGGATNHNRISGNLYATLNLSFRQQPYEVFMADVRLWIPEKRTYTYPDVMIIAGEPIYHGDLQTTITNPQVIVEVLSKSTEGYDGGEKFAAYQTLPTLQEYLLISQTQTSVTHYTRTAKKRWTIALYDHEDSDFAFSTVPAQISLADLYNKVEF